MHGSMSKPRGFNMNYVSLSQISRKLNLNVRVGSHQIRKDMRQGGERESVLWAWQEVQRGEMRVRNKHRGR